MLFDIEAPSLSEMILNAALALLFYICGHGFLFQSCSIGNPEYGPEVWHQTPGALCIRTTITKDSTLEVMSAKEQHLAPNHGRVTGIAIFNSTKKQAVDTS
jgi:hypothetical protein